jgi:hypothetical protein
MSMQILSKSRSLGAPVKHINLAHSLFEYAQAADAGDGDTCCEHIEYAGKQQSS